MRPTIRLHTLLIVALLYALACISLSNSYDLVLAAYQASETPPHTPQQLSADRTVGENCTYKSIQDAIDAANPGDRILVEGGKIFTENVVVNKSLEILGGYPHCKSGSSARTTIDGGKSGRTMDVDWALHVRLGNLNIINGSATLGGGLYIGAGTELHGQNLQIRGNVGTVEGGGLRVYGATTYFTDTLVFNNTSPLGAGVAAIQYTTYPAELSFATNSSIYDNTADKGDALGGGIYLSEGTLTLSGCTDVVSNTADFGGGLYVLTSTVTIQDDCSGINYNTAVEDGGGVYGLNTVLYLMEDVTVSYNSAGSLDKMGGEGGGMFLVDSQVWGDDIHITHNNSFGVGGGLYLDNSDLDMDLGTNGCTGQRCSELSWNSSGTDGGGVAAYDSTIYLEQTYMENNSASFAPALMVHDTNLYLDNVLVTTQNFEYEVISLTDSYFDGLHLTLANRTPGAGTGITMMGSNTVSLLNSIIWGYETSIEETGHTVACSDIQGGYTGTGNIDADPKFVDPGSGNFKLQGDSPAIDRCASGISTDIDDHPRPEVYYRPGTPYDMGAYEAGARVGINGGGCAYNTVQAAATASSTGDSIQAASDTYLENVDIPHDLTIRGGYDSDCTTHAGGTSIIDGSTGAGSIIDITGGLITLQDLELSNGNVATYGGGVDVLGTSYVTLDHTDVQYNLGIMGAGIYIGNNAVVTVTNNCFISHNTATNQGGGVYVLGQFISDGYNFVSQNEGTDGGGIYVTNGGIVQLTGSQVQGNNSSNVNGKGGGLYASAGAVITLTNTAVSFGNHAFDGGGFYVQDASLFLNPGTSIYSNYVQNDGGGLYLQDSEVKASGVRVGFSLENYGNTAVRGAGLFSVNSTVNFTGTIINNVAETAGAGIYADSSHLYLSDTEIGGADVYNSNFLTAEDAAGVGLYLTNGTLVEMIDSHIISNTFLGSNLNMGGGAYLTAQSVMTLTNSSVMSNTAPSTAQGLGGGLCADYSTLVLDSTDVISNSAGTQGGGIALEDASTLTVTHGSLFQGNRSTDGDGGALYATVDPDVLLKNTAFRNNGAFGYGGGIYVDSGNITINGWTQIEDNDGAMGGGAIAASGTADLHISVTSGARTSTISNNRSGMMFGGAMYLTNDALVIIEAVNGHQLKFLTNTAYSNGGAIYASGGPSILLQGDILAIGNRVTDLGDGGFIYISGAGKTLELRETLAGTPRIQLSTARSGGAVYAKSGVAVICNGAEFGDILNGNYAIQYYGGAVYIENSQFYGSNCKFVDNSAALHGGALYAKETDAVIWSEFSTCTPSSGPCSLFSGNTADADADNNGDGGAIYQNGGSLEMTETYLSGNQAWGGGALLLSGSGTTTVLENVLMTGNVSNQSIGGAIRAENLAEITLTHATIADNTGGAALSKGVNAIARLYNSIVWGNSNGTTGIFADAACNIDQSSNTGTAVNPDFVGAGDYHLLGTSPAIDACDTGLSIDLENTTRPIGSKYDMGVYEGEGSPYRYVFVPVVMRNQ